LAWDILEERAAGAKAPLILLAFGGDESPAYRTNEFFRFRPQQGKPSIGLIGFIGPAEAVRLLQSPENPPE
jgi:hypothetical protein